MQEPGNDQMKNPFISWFGRSQRDRQRLASELAGLRASLAGHQLAIEELQVSLRKQRENSAIFEKAFRVSGFIGDYIEFGSYLGGSLIQAYFASRRVLDELASGCWDHAFDDKKSVLSGFQRSWDEMRFISFDSFQGMPEPGAVDAVYRVFPKGSYACSEEEFRANVRKYGIPDEKVVSVPGFFRDTLNDDMARSLGLRQLSIIHIDSDLYESARDALRFCTPFLCDGTILVFDEWFQFRGNPSLGEQRAFREWSSRHPEWVATSFQKEGAYRNSFILSKSHWNMSREE